MIKSVRIKFDKFLHDTGKAILIRIGNEEHWMPKKLCRKLIVNNKLGGNVCIPKFIAEKMNIDFTPEIEYEHHIPEPINKEINHDADLFK